MSSGSIYPYIPFASSLVWNRYSQDSDVKVHVSFSPDWFSDRIDLDYGERWHRDHVYRRRSFVDMAKALNQEFPELKLGGVPEQIRGGISQIDTCALVASFFGQDILFYHDRWPENKNRPLSDSEAEGLEIPRISEHPVFEELMRQMDSIESEWGRVDGELNYQGVLNTAFRLRGEQIFLDMIAAPERAHHVLNIVCKTMIDLADRVYARQEKSGVRKDFFVTSNCVVNMISEDHYREFVMPYDRLLAEHYRYFGIHNCGWTVNTYARAYSEIGVLGYLDFGIRSDFELLRELFPETVLTVILNPEDVLGRSPADIEADLRSLKEELGNCFIIVGSLDGSTKSEQIMTFFHTTAKVWALPMQELIPVAHFG